MNRRTLLKTPILAAVAALCPPFLRRLWASPAPPMVWDPLRGAGGHAAPPLESEKSFVACYGGANPTLELVVDFYQLWERKDGTHLTGYIVFSEPRAKVLESRDWDWFAILGNHVSGLTRSDGPWNPLTCEVALLDHRLSPCLLVDAAGVHIVPDSEWGQYYIHTKAIILPRDRRSHRYRGCSPDADNPAPHL